ncbi:MAG TPA: hypothetical protein VN495_03855 [Candidatus Paceibacterota bacterium]|nr:hypothetical protein [Candidatus Paceibacterota bacterium]
MLPYRDSKLAFIALVVFFAIAILYALFEASGMLLGPTIHVDSQSLEVHEPYVTIQGQADRISSLAMNGASISVTETGAFSEPYLLAPGYNRIVLDAKDNYGRTTQKTLEIVYAPDSTISPQATTTAASSASRIFATSTSPRATTTPGSSSTPPMAPGQ